MTTETNSITDAVKNALKQMLSEGAKINVSTVAKRAGTTHTNLWKHYPELYEEISKIRDHIKADKEKVATKALIEKQKKEIKRLKSKIKNKNKKNQENQENQELNIDALVMAKLTELYRDYDYQLRKNIDLANINLHGDCDIDIETGEVINTRFRKDK